MTGTNVNVAEQEHTTNIILSGNVDATINSGRQTESPARTIDSHDSTNGSLETIVDCNDHHQQRSNQEKIMQTTIDQSTNTTNLQQQQHYSLTNSEVAMLQLRNSSGSEDELLHQHQYKQQQQQYQQQQQHQQRQEQEHAHAKPLDSQSHIYSSPVYEEKPQLPLKLPAALIVKQNLEADDLKKPKLVTHEEFKRQLEEAMAHKAATLDSRISKKQRFPPELIKDDGSSIKSSKLLKKELTQTESSDDCCFTYPLQIILGLLQLVLAVSLVALGSLLIVREASLSTAGCGIWTGLIAAITGSMGVVALKPTHTAFLALSLVCIATSTLALAITGIGLSRDVNQSKDQFDLLNANSVASAASGLIFALFLHFVISVVSVYRCALQICSR